MEIYRLSRRKYSNQLSGIGASLRGGRWNSMGTEVIYCASSRALAMAEVLVHLSMQNLPNDFMMISIHVPENIQPIKIAKAELAEGWSSFPHLAQFQEIGDQFVNDRKSCLLQIPSVVVAGDWNFLINPAHPDFDGIKILDRQYFKFDQRLLER